ncbi:MAG: replicative DNA helicase, partial [Cyanobacteria bacterium]|nr:replicative DNA helicase [Cyanobacteriota bacterium]
RRLIHIGGEISQLGFETSDPLEQSLDQAEQRLFAITQDRPQQALTSTADILIDTFSDIEQRSLGMILPGIPCGFYDLDAMTQGFQRSDLIIVAGRPSMGKTAFTIQLARNIAQAQKLPVAIFSLEMSKQQLIYRLLSGEVAMETSRLRTGRIAQHEWEMLGQAISTLSQFPIFIDDTPNISVAEMRSKARRLQAEQGGALGLILIDYLQLMEGTSDNRVQELSKITRSLKGLARELNVPIISLSQLSRGVESRTNKRPMMSDLRECVTGDTLVWLADGRRLPIQDLVGTTPEVISLDAQNRLVKAKADLIWEVGTKPIYVLKTSNGKTIRATGKHRLYTFEGWQRLQDLKVGDRLATANHMPMMGQPAPRWPDSRVILLGHLIGDGSYLTHQPLRYTTASEANSAVVKSAAEEFGCTVNRHPGKGNWHQLVISGDGNRWHPAGVNLWLRELGIFNQRSAQKHVPPQVFRLPDDQIALLLRHLWATDGCISSYYHPNGKKYKASIFFATVSQQLANDVVALLLRLGITSQVQWAKSNCYNVQIYGKTQQLKFLDTVGAFGPRIEPAEAVRTELLNRGKANPNKDTLPIEVFGLIKAEMKAQGISQRQMAASRGTSYGGSSHFKFAPPRDVVLGYTEVLDSPELREIAATDLFWDEIVSIEPAGEETVYDLTVPGPASWMADGLVSHNSGSIEQDADLIMMLYREEYYDPDTPDRGITEIIINKHRNGPTGTIKLLFEPQYTRFRNLMAQQ